MQYPQLDVTAMVQTQQYWPHFRLEFERVLARDERR